MSDQFSPQGSVPPPPPGGQPSPYAPTAAGAPPQPGPPPAAPYGGQPAPAPPYAQPAPPAPPYAQPAYGQPAGYAPALPADVYSETVNLDQVLPPQQRQQLMQHQLSSFPTWLAVVLHFLTLGIFSVIYQGLKFSKLPKAKTDDFGAGKAIGFLFIPFYNLYWVFRFWLSLSDRINFQFRLRGQQPPVSRGVALAYCIVGLVPYVGFLVAWPILGPIVVGQLQSATNKLAAERY